ncbi:hypothetical protein LLG46_14240 [bacterium]|nr:hypothetical protein [bacterium]
MRFMQSAILCLVVLVSMYAQAEAVGVVKVDPNTVAKSGPKEDLRLSQKITYDSGYKRLNYVTDDLSRMTGVNILCGQNKNDWKVRDIPVVVCVKDLPLGKLLRAIADATHTRFTSEKIGDNPEKSYRIYRRSTDQEQLDVYVQKQHDYSLEDAAWQWDALTAYGKSNDNPPDDSSLRDTWLIARMIAGLGSDSKDKLLDGDTLTFRGTDPANSAYLEEYYRHICEQAYNPSHTSCPQFENVENAPLGIKLVDNGVEAGIEMLFSPGPIKTDDGTYIGFSIGGNLHDAGALQDKVTGLPPRPKAAPTPSLDDEIANPEMTPLSGRMPDDTTNDSFLMTKITLEESLSATDLTFAKAIQAIAQTGQCNIVTEDFTSQKAQKYQWLNSNLRDHTKKSVSDILNMFGGSTWFVNEDDSLIIGWQNRRQNWREHHANLLPEEYLNGLMTKLNGEGLTLEDVIHMSNIPEPSAKEWVVYTDDFKDLYQWKLDPAWRLYDALTLEDKQLAKSNDGLPLGKFDSTWIADFFRAEKMRQLPSLEPAYFASPGMDIEAYRDGVKQNNLALSDPAIISTMVMRIQKKPAKERYAEVNGVGTSVEIPKGLNLSRYDMVITYKLNGEERSIPIYGTLLAFPVWSAEHEAEVVKATSAGNRQ